MDERKYSDEQFMVGLKGLLKIIAVRPFCWLAAKGVGTKFWKEAQFVRANHALMDMWNFHTNFGTRPQDEIQEDEWDKIELLEKGITALSHAIQNTDYKVFTFD